MLKGFPKETSKYQLIVSDFDGTLAGVDHVVSVKNINAVKKWERQGKFFTVATGRQFLMIKEDCRKMGLTTPVVVRGGAEVIDPQKGTILHSEYIPKDDVKMVLEMLMQDDIFQFGIEMGDNVYANFHWEISTNEINEFAINEFKIQSVPKFHVKPIHQDNGKCEDLIKKLENKSSHLNIIATHNKMFGKGWDITSVKATKLHGIVKVLEHLGLEKEQTVGVGDSYNDFPLLEATDLKVAMGNAHEEIKAITDIVVPSHDEDGVAYLITKLLENSKS